MYSSAFMGVWRNISFRSMLKSIAPFFWYLRVHCSFISLFPVDLWLGILNLHCMEVYPPTTSLIRYCSSFSGWWSHTKLVYVTFLLVCTLECLINSMVSVDSTPALLPWAKRTYSFLNTGIHIFFCHPLIVENQ